jgi:hypothetical protein
VALLPPIHKGRITQGFGPSAINAEPAMFADAKRANFAAGQAMKFFDHFHSALDISAKEGTPILASESGKVIFASRQQDHNLKIQVQINPTTSYSSNHCSKLLVKAGEKVVRGQPIAKVGHSGFAIGDHNHFWVQVDQVSEGFVRHNFHDPLLYLPGGALAASDLILPPGGGVAMFVQLNGPGINIRTAPTLTLSSIFATSTSDGIVRLGKVISPLDREMRFGGLANGDGLVWVRARIGGAYRFISKSLVHFVV